MRGMRRGVGRSGGRRGGSIVTYAATNGSDLLLCEPPRGIEPLTYSLRKAVLGSSDGQRQFRMRW